MTSKHIPRPWATSKHIAHLLDIAEDFDALVLDQWGVLHDGNRAFAGAEETVTRLAASGTLLLTLSNTAKRSAANARLLAEIGFNPDHFDAIITSGELFWQLMAHHNLAEQYALGQHCLPLTRHGENITALLHGLPIRLVERVSQASFLLLASVDSDISIKAFDALFSAALKQQLPLLCINPDRYRVTAERRFLNPGSFAARYSQRGGTVHYLGKPQQRIFQRLANRLADVPPTRILMVGDSPQHDIQGANSVGWSSLLLLNGLLREDCPQDDEENTKHYLQQHYQQLSAANYISPDLATLPIADATSSQKTGEPLKNRYNSL